VTQLTSKEDQRLGRFILRKVGFTHRVLDTCVWCTRLNHDLFLVPNPTGYPPQQYSSSHPSLAPTPSRRSTLATTPTYDHVSLPSHPPAPPPLSASTSHNPLFPVPAVPARHPSTNPSGPPPPGPSPMLHRSATMSMPVHPNTTSSMPMPVHPNNASSVPMPVHPNNALSTPYDMQPSNTMHSSSQPGNLGGPQSSTHGYTSYRASTVAEFPTVHAYNERLTADVHERHGDSSNFSNENPERSREGARHSGEYMRERAPPNYFSAGNQQLRCTYCGIVSTRAAVESRRPPGYCNGHMGQWQVVIIILSLYQTNN